MKAKRASALLAVFVILGLCPSVRAQTFKAPCPRYGWYPAERDTLAAMVDGFLADAGKVKLDGDLFGIIAPHAGYKYSGPVAAFAYAAARSSRAERVVVMGPFHGLFNRGITARDFADVAVLDAETYETPLGTVAVDTGAVRRLIAADPRIRASTAMFIEHSVDAQIPFIQRVLPGVPIVPIIIGKPTLETARWLAPLLKAKLSDRRTLYVASSDLSHYHPYDEAKEHDARTLALVKALDLEGLDAKIDGSDMCGRGDVMVLLHLFKITGGGKVVILDQRNSGDTAGDKSKVVGYGAVALLKEPPQAKGAKASAAESKEKAKKPAAGDK